MDASKELRTSSDTLLDDLALLANLEQQKRQLEPGSPELVSVAQQIEDLARRVLGLSQRQRSLTEKVTEIVETSQADLPTIEETPREIHLILSDWRDAERRAQAASPGSRDAEAATADIKRFREEYRAAHDYARRRRG